MTKTYSSTQKTDGSKGNANDEAISKTGKGRDAGPTLKEGGGGT